MYTKKIEEKVPGKVGECIFDSQKCKSFQGPKAGPGPQPIFYSSLRLPDFASLCRQNLAKNFWGPPLTKSWICYWPPTQYTPGACKIRIICFKSPRQGILGLISIAPPLVMVNWIAVLVMVTNCKG